MDIGDSGDLEFRIYCFCLKLFSTFAGTYILARKWSGKI
jgi:hypothetical protein